MTAKFATHLKGIVLGLAVGLLLAAGLFSETAYAAAEYPDEWREDIVFSEDYTFRKRPEAFGKRKITIKKNVTVTCEKGIAVNPDHELTIEGTGTLIVKGVDNCAGIGGSWSGCAAGRIIINGCTIIATNGDNRGAAIGGACYGGGGYIEINGGNVEAIGNPGPGGNGATGIGSGADADGSNVKITGGTVYAEGSGYGSGIGTYGGTGAYCNCTVNITGGTVTAKSNRSGIPGIGASTGLDPRGSTISISGGNVESTGIGLYTENSYDRSRVNLSWTNYTDSIKSTGYDAKTVYLDKGFADDNTQNYFAKGNVANPATLNNAVLVPPVSWGYLQTRINNAGSGETITLVGDAVAKNTDSALVVPEEKNITIDLAGHKIDRNIKFDEEMGNGAREDGNVITVNGTLTVKDSGDDQTGAVTGGANKGNGGGVYVASGAVFNLESGAITGNVAAFSSSGISSSGGGVYVAGGTFHMSGGQITDNIACADGGGVCVGRGSFRVEGDTVVSGNNYLNTSYHRKTPNNVQTYSGKINIAGELGDSASIGVCPSSDMAVNEQGKSEVRTSGLKEKGSLDNFFADNTVFHLALNSDGELIIGRPYEVHYKAGEYGEGSMSQGEAIDGEILTAESNGFTPRGDYLFVNWKVGDGDLAVDPGETVEVSRDICTQITQYDYEVDFTAQWVDGHHAVTWLDHDGSELRTTSVEHMTKPVWEGDNPTRKADIQYSYTFAGWAKEAEQESGTAVADLPEVTEDITYYAAYSKTLNKYDVSFDMTWASGASQMDPIKDIEYGSTFDAPADVPTTTDEDLTFGGWCKDAACTEAWKFDTDTVKGPTTLYAKWVHIHDDTTFQPWVPEDSMPSSGGNYYLVNDVTLNYTWAPKKGETTRLCLRGKKISRTGEGRVIELPRTDKNSGTGKTTLHIYDETGDGQITGGNGSTYGGGIYVQGGNGQVYQGTEDAILYLHGGNITGNSSENSGGGVYVAGQFYMYGGVISGNSAVEDSMSRGGGVYLSNTGKEAVFEMHGGIIRDNQATTGGGVYSSYETLRIYGGSIVNNVAKSRGGGVEAVGTIFIGGESDDKSEYKSTVMSTINITGNTSHNKADNFSIMNYPHGDSANTKLQIMSQLTEDSRIGLTSYSHPNAGEEKVLTNGFAERGTENNFFSDMAYDKSSFPYKLVVNDGDELALVKAYTISFDAGEGSGSKDDVIITDKEGGVTYKLPAKTTFDPPEDKIFDFWEIDGEKYDEKTEVEITKNTTVKATWIIYHTVTFDKNAEEATGSMEPAIVKHGAEYKLPRGQFIYDMHTFDGWIVGDKTCAAEESIDVLSDTVAKVNWKADGMSLFIGGVQVTGDNYRDVFDDGTVSVVMHQDADPKFIEINLNNANIETKKRNDGSEPDIEYGIRSNIPEYNIKINLSGSNSIVDNERAEGIAGKYGIAVYQAPNLTFAGEGTLDISMQASEEYADYYSGLHCRMNTAIDGTKIGIALSGAQIANGVEIVGDHAVCLKNSAEFKVATGSNEQSSAIVNNSDQNDDIDIEEGSVFEAVSGNVLFTNVELTDDSKTYGALVNTEPNDDGVLWDNTTDLNTYKYVLIPYATDKTNLEPAVQAAADAESGVATSEDGKDLPDGTVYTTAAEKKALDDAIDSAQAVMNDPSVNQKRIDAATKAITDATATYNDAKKTAEVDKKDLQAAVTAAQNAEAGVKTSADGKDVAKSDQWTTPAARKALDDAIAAAQQTADDPEVSQNDVDKAKTDIKAATDAFNKAKKKGTKPNGTDPGQKGYDGTPVGPGASAKAAENAITSAGSDADPRGSRFAPVKLKSIRQGNTNIQLTWSSAGGANKYVVYGNACGRKYKMKKLAVTTGRRLNVKKISKKLKRATYYKFIMVALDKDDVVVSTSKIVHVATKGKLKKAANPKSVIVKAKVNKNGKKLKRWTKTSAVAVKAGKDVKLKGSFNKARRSRVKKHAAIRYESSNTNIATVTAKGSVKGKAEGICYIYAYAQNGIMKRIKVSVK